MRFYDDDDADDDDEIYLERDRLKVIRYMLSPWLAAGKKRRDICIHIYKHVEQKKRLKNSV